MSGVNGFGVADNQAFSAIQREVGEHPINASRIKPNYRHASNLRDGAPIPERNASIPQTGITRIDRAAERAAAMSQFGEHAVRSATDSAVKGGMYGCLCGLAIVFISQKNALFSLLQLPWALVWERRKGLANILKEYIPWHFLAANMLIGGAGALMGGILGLRQATRGSAQDFQTLINERKPKLAKQNAQPAGWA